MRLPGQMVPGCRTVRNCHTHSQSGLSVTHCPQHRGRVPAAPHPTSDVVNHLIVAILHRCVMMIPDALITFPQSLKTGPSSKDTFFCDVSGLLSNFYCVVCFPIELWELFVYSVYNSFAREIQNVLFHPVACLFFFIFLVLSLDEQEY